MSGASGKVPAAIHVSPEASDGGSIGLLEDGDLVSLDAEAGTLEVHADLSARPPANAPSRGTTYGRHLFGAFRANVGSARSGGAIFQTFGEEREK